MDRNERKDFFRRQMVGRVGAGVAVAQEVIQLIKGAGRNAVAPPGDLLASIYVQLAAADASFATGNIYGSGGEQRQS